MHIARFYLFEILVEHFCHRRTGDIGAFAWESAFGKIPAGMLRISEIDIRDDIDYSAVCLLGEAFVLASVACFHVEDRDMQSLSANDAQAGVGVAKYENGIGFRCHHELVRGIDDIATGGAKVIAYGIHIYLRVCKLEVVEEDAIEVVVVVLTRMGENDIEVLACLVDDSCKADDFRTGAHDNEQLKFAVVLEVDIGIICS